MTDEQRMEQLRQAAEALMGKVVQWVQQLDPAEAKPQEVRQLCGTLKDLKDLCRELDAPEQGGFTVIIEGGEEDWNS